MTMSRRNLLAGAGAAAASTLLSRAAGAQSFPFTPNQRYPDPAVQILDPRIDPRHWDLVVVPEHDRVRGPNVVNLLGSLHPVDDAWLAQARLDHAEQLSAAGAFTALLVGGASAHAHLDDAGFDALLATLRARTPAKLVEFSAADLERAELAEVASGHAREEG